MNKKEYKKYNCPICDKEVLIRAGDIRIKKGQNKFYCGNECYYKSLRKGEIKKCLICGKEFYSTRHKLCSNKCSVEYKKKNYKHKEYYENDYIVIYKNGYNKKGNAKLHRYIMEQLLGRRLTKDEVVHHIDGNKQNNNIDNLVVMSRKEHSKMHRLEDIKNGKKLFGRL